MAMMTYTIILTGINLILTLALLVVYIRNYRDIKAAFSLGLIIFAFLLSVQKTVSIYIYTVLMYEFDDVVGLGMLILETLQFLAFSVLVYITMK